MKVATSVVIIVATAFSLRSVAYAQFTSSDLKALTEGGIAVGSDSRKKLYEEAEEKRVLDRLEAERKENMRHPRWETIKYPNGEQYEGYLVGYVREGHGAYTWPNGQKFVGNFSGNFPDGRGTLTLANGKQYVGIFSKGKYIGPEKSSSDNERRAINHHDDGHGIDLVTIVLGAAAIAGVAYMIFGGQEKNTYGVNSGNSDKGIGGTVSKKLSVGWHSYSDVCSQVQCGLNSSGVTHPGILRYWAGDVKEIYFDGEKLSNAMVKVTWITEKSPYACGQEVVLRLADVKNYVAMPIAFRPCF